MRVSVGYRVECGRVPRGGGIERATAAVCRHLVRDGTRVVNLVTEESMFSCGKFTAKSGFRFLLITTKQTDRDQEGRSPSPPRISTIPWHFEVLSVIAARPMGLTKLLATQGSPVSGRVYGGAS